MLYYLSAFLLAATAGTDWGPSLSPLRVFKYITVRTAGAAVTALLLSLLLGPRVIARLREFKFGQMYRDRAAVMGGLARQGAKRGTPTMGGLLIVLAIDFSVLLWAQWTLPVVLTLTSLLGLAALGFYDDYLKVTQQDAHGTKARVKLYCQAGLALGIAVYLWSIPATRALVTDIRVPFFKHPVATGMAAIGMTVAVLAIVGSSNAVNLTDGLDGLAIGCTLIVDVVLLVFTYVTGHARFAAYLQLPYVAGAGELTVICAALFGAGLGFLYYNCHPAQVFMGDTGSLALGGTLGIVAVLVHQPFILVIAGGVFVAEIGSVVCQVGYCRLNRRFRGVDRRLFLMTPLHHHFEKLGWSETKVVTRFQIMCVLCAVLALATLKLR